MEKGKIDYLAKNALYARAQVLRMIRVAGSGHLASSLGICDVLTYWYECVLRAKPEQPDWAERDLFLLSAGHLCPAWYATLARRKYFPEKLLLTLRQLDSPLAGHPHRNVSLGIENSAGSLGQGVSMAVGAALALQRNGTDRQVYVLASDGEQQEGQVWEAYQVASHYHLDNLTVIIDVNGIQQSGKTVNVLDLGDLAGKMTAFGFGVHVCDGHDFEALEQARAAMQAVTGKPHCLLARTTPGKGIALLENDYHWHAAAPSEEQWHQIFADLAGQLHEHGISIAKDA